MTAAANMCEVSLSRLKSNVFWCRAPFDDMRKCKFFENERVRFLIALCKHFRVAGNRCVCSAANEDKMMIAKLESL